MKYHSEMTSVEARKIIWDVGQYPAQLVREAAVFIIGRTYSQPRDVSQAYFRLGIRPTSELIRDAS